jgi:hypothetical protein
MPRPVLRFVSTYLILSAFAATALLIDTWPHQPRSFLQWALLLVIALPVTVLGDWLSEHTLSNPLARVAVSRTKRVRFSWLRIGYCLALYILFAICVVALLYWFQLAMA